MMPARFTRGAGDGLVGVAAELNVEPITQYPIIKLGTHVTDMRYSR